MIYRRLFFFVIPLLVIVVVFKLFILVIPNPGLLTKTTVSAKKNVIVVKSPKKNIKQDIDRKEPGGNGLAYTVVIDPGHGGSDSGCRSSNGIEEKTINLDFSFALARALRARGINAYLTRSGDYDMDLDDRYVFALEKNPDIFISVHAAYSEIRTLKGPEIFSFSSDAPRSELESRENINKLEEADELEVTGRKLSVLKDKEERVGLYILNSISRGKTDIDMGNFDALRAFNDMPALMLFTGYLSNKDDVKWLSKESNVDAYALKIAESIDHGLSLKLPVKQKVKKFLGGSI